MNFATTTIKERGLRAQTTEAGIFRCSYMERGAFRNCNSIAPMSMRSAVAAATTAGDQKT